MSCSNVVEFNMIGSLIEDETVEEVYTAFPNPLGQLSAIRIEFYPDSEKRGGIC